MSAAVEQIHHILADNNNNNNNADDDDAETKEWYLTELAQVSTDAERQDEFVTMYDGFLTGRRSKETSRFPFSPHICSCACAHADCLTPKHRCRIIRLILDVVKSSPTFFASAFASIGSGSLADELVLCNALKRGVGISPPISLVDPIYLSRKEKEEDLLAPHVVAGQHALREFRQVFPETQIDVFETVTADDKEEQSLPLTGEYPLILMLSFDLQMTREYWERMIRTILCKRLMDGGFLFITRNGFRADELPYRRVLHRVGKFAIHRGDSSIVNVVFTRVLDLNELLFFTKSHGISTLEPIGYYFKSMYVPAGRTTNRMLECVQQSITTQSPIYDRTIDTNERDLLRLLGITTGQTLPDNKNS